MPYLGTARHKPAQTALDMGPYVAYARLVLPSRSSLSSSLEYSSIAPDSKAQKEGEK